jgi:hypothetical protein
MEETLSGGTRYHMLQGMETFSHLTEPASESHGALVPIVENPGLG